MSSSTEPLIQSEFSAIENPIAFYSVDPRFSLKIPSTQYPNWFVRKVQRFFFGIYWQKVVEKTKENRNGQVY